MRNEYPDCREGNLSRSARRAFARAVAIVAESLEQRVLLSSPEQVVFLSDLIPTGVVNGWGAYEKDRSNGENGPADGHALTLAGVTYAKGLGVHAYSSLKYDLTADSYTRFQSAVGVDDEVGNYGSVVFQVYLDNTLAWQSPTLRGSSPTSQVDIPVAGKGTMELRVIGTSDGIGCDHADWAGARLLSSSVPDTTPPTPNPSGWAVWPTAIGHDAIRMEAAAATDPSGVLYYFESLTTAFTVAETSGWQESPVWVDTGLTPGMVYGYRVRTSDKSPAHNTTGWSSLGTANTTVPPSTQYLSDLTPVSENRPWGPYERDRSNGEDAAGDGKTITLNGVPYIKGLGVHAGSILKYNLTGLNKTRFKADVGVDDEVTAGGSVIFEVWLDGVLAKSTAKMTSASATESIAVDITGKSTLELRVTGAGDGVTADHADWADALLDDGAVSVPQTVYLSDLVPATKPINGFGEYERDRSNGNAGPNDGTTIRLNGQTYTKGLGVHADSVMTYSLIGRNGAGSRFQSDIGVDDEVKNAGSVVFQVWLDGVKVYDSGRMTGASATKQIDLQIAGKNTLELRVTGAGDGYTCDHADWAGARLVKIPAIATIRGTVWRDFDADGNRDANDTGLAGQRVYLNTVPNPGYDAREPSTLSGPDGSYALTNLPTGDYTVSVVPPAGWKATVAQHDLSLFPGDNKAGQDFLLAAPNEAPTVNAGADRTVTLGANGLATINLSGTTSDDGQPGVPVLGLDQGVNPHFNIVREGVFGVDVPQYFNHAETSWNTTKHAYDVMLYLANRQASGSPFGNAGIRVFLEEKLVDEWYPTDGPVQVYHGIEVGDDQLTVRLQQMDADADPYAAISALLVNWQDGPLIGAFDFGTTRFESPSYAPVTPDTAYQKANGAKYGSYNTIPAQDGSSLTYLGSIFTQDPWQEFYMEDRDLYYGWLYQKEQVYWHALSGPAAVGFADREKLNASATFSKSGSYDLELWSVDGELQNVDRMTVTVQPASGLAISGIVLVDADTGGDIAPLSNGALIDLSVLGSRRLNIRADTNPGVVGSVRFELTGQSPVIDNVRLYTVAAPGQSWAPASGFYQLKVTPYSGPDGRGIVGEPTSIYFDVTDSDAASVTGLTAHYYLGDDEGHPVVGDRYSGALDSVPPWNERTKHTDKIDFHDDFDTEGRKDFYVEFTGQIRATAGGTYSFTLDHDFRPTDAKTDRARLWIDNHEVASTFYEDSRSSMSGSVRLQAGQRHEIRVDFLHREGHPRLTLKWAPPGDPERVVAANDLYRSADTRMAWWRQARFGMFIHFGLYSILAGEWDGQPTPAYGAEWIRYDRKIGENDYHALQGQFDPEKFDARQWVSLAKRAGMEYIVITTKHHDGWHLFDTDTTSNYDIASSAFAQRRIDLVGELVAEARRQGLRVGLYYSVMDWDHELWRGWRSLSPVAGVRVTDGLLKVTLLNGSTTGRLIADAVRVRRADRPDDPWLVIDNDGRGYTEEAGGWNDKADVEAGPNSGYQGSFRWAQGSAKVSWTFSNLPQGTYVVQTTWQRHPEVELHPDFVGTDLGVYSVLTTTDGETETVINQSSERPGDYPGHPQPADYVEHMKHQFEELKNLYGDIDLFWSDGPWGYTPGEFGAAELVARIRKLWPNATLNDRIGLDNDVDNFRESKPLPPAAQFWDWEYPMMTNWSWGYKASDQNWKTSTEIIRWLAGTVSKGGNLVLNVGPTGQGLFPLASVKILDEVGDWLRVNGESIYGAGAWDLAPGYSPEGLVVTQRSNRLYIHVPGDGIDGVQLDFGDRTPGRAYLLAHPSIDVQKGILPIGNMYGLSLAGIPQEMRDPADTVIVVEVD